MAPRFQLELFDSRNGLTQMQEAVNRWLDAASGEVLVVDRQVIAATQTFDGDARLLEPYVVVAIWYTKIETAP